MLLDIEQNRSEKEIYNLFCYIFINDLYNSYNLIYARALIAYCCKIYEQFGKIPRMKTLFYYYLSSISIKFK